MNKRIHTLEAEIDKVVWDLQVDLKSSKDIFETGISYNFFFFDTAVSICIPTYPPYDDDGLVRAEFTIGSVDAKEVGGVVFAILLDIDKDLQFPLRVVPRTKDQMTYTLLLQLVCPRYIVQPRFMATVLQMGCDLAKHYRENFLSQRAA